MANLDSILKSRDVTLPTKVHLVKAMVFPVVMYACESWTRKKAEHRRIDAFELWCWRRLLRVPWLQENPVSPSYRKSVLNIQWKGWCWSWHSNTLATWCEELTHYKRSRSLKRLKAGEGTTEAEMVEWYHRLDGHEFERALGVGDGKGSLACCSPWGCKELDTLSHCTELNSSIQLTTATHRNMNIYNETINFS